MNDKVELLLSVANDAPRQSSRRNGKTLILDGIECEVFIKSDCFVFVPTSNIDEIHRKYFGVLSFGRENIEKFFAYFSSIKIHVEEPVGV
jgi:hypothetical protein